QHSKVLRQCDGLGDGALLSLESSELGLVVLIEFGLTPHDQPGGSTRGQRLIDLPWRRRCPYLSASGNPSLLWTQAADIGRHDAVLPWKSPRLNLMKQLLDAVTSGSPVLDQVGLIGIKDGERTPSWRAFGKGRGA